VRTSGVKKNFTARLPIATRAAADYFARAAIESRAGQNFRRAASLCDMMLLES
jgi:hypothetical protein